MNTTSNYFTATIGSGKAVHIIDSTAIGGAATVCSKNGANAKPADAAPTCKSCANRAHVLR